MFQGVCKMVLNSVYMLSICLCITLLFWHSNLMPLYVFLHGFLASYICIYSSSVHCICTAQRKSEI